MLKAITLSSLAGLAAAVIIAGVWAVIEYSGEANYKAPDPPQVIVVGKYQAELWVWKRPDQSCYLSISVPGWELIFLDATGSICDRERNTLQVAPAAK